jgi:non-ribosomal peptide synthetase component F
MTAQYLRIVVNDEGQYALWPFVRPGPPGWADTHFVGSRVRCLAQITELARSHPADPAPKLGATVPGRLATISTRMPDRTAASGGGQRLTFRELERRSDALARTVAEYGVRRGETVGLHLRPGVDALVARLGVLKAGAAYLPVRVDCPPVPSLRLLVTEPDLAAAAARHGVPVLAWRRRTRADRGPGRTVRPIDAAYVAAGPGPVGGLLLDHRHLIIASEAALAAGGLLPGGRPVQCRGLTPPDAAEVTLWGPLLHGAEVRLDHHPALDPEAMQANPDGADPARSGLTMVDPAMAAPPGGRWYVLDEELHPAPEGVLYLGASWLGRGYAGRPARTARWLLPDPFDQVGGATMLCTGLRARRDDDGALVLLDP